MQVSNPVSSNRQTVYLYHTNIMNKKVRLEQNYWTIRELFEEELVENWYDPETVDEIYIWREEFVEKERKLFKELYSEDIENY